MSRTWGWILVSSVVIASLCGLVGVIILPVAKQVKARAESTVHQNKGVDYFEQNDFDKALEELNEAVRLDPTNHGAIYSRARVWEERFESEKAIADFNEAIRLSPKDTDYLYGRAHCWADQGEYEKAIPDYEAIIRLDQTYPLAYEGLADAQKETKKYDQAIHNYTRAISFDPGDSNLFYQRGLVHFERRHLEKAKADFDEALRLSPDSELTALASAAVRVSLKHADALTFIQQFLKELGWEEAYSGYLVVLGHLAARQQNQPELAKQFLAESQGKLLPEWPEPVVRFLRKEIDEPALLKELSGIHQETEARYYLAIDHLLQGRQQPAKLHLQWIKEKGHARAFPEYTLAMIELERLDKLPDPKKNTGKK